MSPQTVLACPRCHTALSVTSDETLRCGTCPSDFARVDGVVNFVPPSPVNEWQAFFETNALSAQGDTAEAVSYRAPAQFAAVIEGFHRACGVVPSDARILDVGCGNGLFARSLFPDRDVAGIDYSHAMCRHAAQRGVNAFQADASALPFADEQFDLLYCAEIIQYIDDLPQLLAEFARVTVPGGSIVVSTLNRTSIVRRVLRAVGWSTQKHTLRRTAGDIVAASAGLPLRVQRACWLHMPLPFIRCAKSPRYMFEPFASNVIVAFVKST